MSSYAGHKKLFQGQAVFDGCFKDIRHTNNSRTHRHPACQETYHGYKNCGRIATLGIPAYLREPLVSPLGNILDTQEGESGAPGQHSYGWDTPKLEVILSHVVYYYPVVLSKTSWRFFLCQNLRYFFGPLFCISQESLFIRFLAWHRVPAVVQSLSLILYYNRFSGTSCVLLKIKPSVCLPTSVMAFTIS